MTESIRVVHHLPHPPEAVWAALTDAARLSRWLMPTDFEPEVGAAFTLDTGSFGVTRCEVLAIEPGRLLRYTWRNGPLDTTVTWALTPVDGGAEVTLEHAGFDTAHPAGRMAFEGMGRGWPMIIGHRLVAELGG